MLRVFRVAEPGCQERPAEDDQPEVDRQDEVEHPPRPAEEHPANGSMSPAASSELTAGVSVLVAVRNRALANSTSRRARAKYVTALSPRVAPTTCPGLHARPAGHHRQEGVQAVPLDPAQRCPVHEPRENRYRQARNASPRGWRVRPDYRR